MKKFAILVAGGSGTRMNSVVPKQFLLLAGKPVLMQTMLKFFAADPGIFLILVLPEIHINFWKELCLKYEFLIPHSLVSGGQVRFESVKNGLLSITEDGLVAVHDGVRPLISPDRINFLFEVAMKNGSAIPSIPVQDSLRSVSGKKNVAVDRSTFRIIQTPQIFNVRKLKDAFSQPFQLSFTDEATVMESFGETIFLSEGEPANIKITTENDLLFAESVFSL